MPPLRDRREDIPILARHFMERYTRRYNLTEKKLSDSLVEDLMNQEWRGNVRELDNNIHRGVILSGDNEIIDKEHIDNPLFSNIHAEQGREVLSGLPLMPIEDMAAVLINKMLV